tara:strand:- start:1092 stop:1328 length:237 start_codon:yes stop_codon:yes gene_type:complete
MTEELDEAKKIIEEDGLGRLSEDLFNANLQTMLIVIGSYLYSGGDLTELEDKLLKRLSLLLDMHIHRDVQVHVDINLH